MNSKEMMAETFSENHTADVILYLESLKEKEKVLPWLTVYTHLHLLIKN